MSEEEAKQLVRDAIRYISSFFLDAWKNHTFAGLEFSTTWDQAATLTWW